MDCFVVEIQRSMPCRLIRCEDFKDAKQKCAILAAENGVTEKEIKEEILDDDSQPGAFYPGYDDFGVWVVMAE